MAPKILCGLLALCAFGIQITRADDAPPTLTKQYVAELEITPSSGTSLSTKIYVDFTKMRTDTTVGGVQMEMIVMWAKRLSYTIMPANKLLLVSDLDPSSPITTGALPTDGTWKNLGTDTVEGVSCSKFEFTDNAGKSTFFWFNGSTPVEMLAADNSLKVVYKSFTPGEPDPSVFTLPQGYQAIKMNKPAAGMGVPQITH